MTDIIREENKEFISLLLRTTLPLMLQSFFLQSISFVGQVMVGKLGTDAIAAVGAANKVFTVYNSFLYGSCSASAMFLAQYWGKKDIRNFQKILGITLTITAIMGSLAGLLVFLFPRQILSVFINDSTVIGYGTDYIKTVSLYYLLTGLVFPLNFALRSTNKVAVSMTTTGISVVVSVLSNYALIAGKFGCPELGVRGAAISNILTRLVELSMLILYFVLSGNPIFKNFREMFSYTMEYTTEFVKRAVPLIGNELLWSIGTTIYFIIYGKAGIEQFAAMSIMQILQMVAKIMTSSFCGSSAIVIGNEIGRGDTERVNRFARKYQKISILVGVVSGAALLVLIKPILSIYSITGTEVGKYVQQCMYILSIFIVMNSYNSINVEGIFRSGGDAKYIMLMDMGSIWFVGMPVTIITGLLMKMDIVYIYSAFIVVELYKLPLGISRYKTGKWMHHLHRLGEEDEEFVCVAE